MKSRLALLCLVLATALNGQAEDLDLHEVFAEFPVQEMIERDKSLRQVRPMPIPKNATYLLLRKVYPSGARSECVVSLKAVSSRVRILAPEERNLLVRGVNYPTPSTLDRDFTQDGSRLFPFRISIVFGSDPMIQEINCTISKSESEPGFQTFLYRDLRNALAPNFEVVIPEPERVSYPDQELDGFY